jgi:hypothetical protein
MKFEYTLTDEEFEGVAKSLEAHNNSKPQQIDNPDFIPSKGNEFIIDPDDNNLSIANPDFVEAIGEPKIANPDLIDDENAYLNFVFSECFKSYQKQFKSDA